jgi:hypothetical protein
MSLAGETPAFPATANRDRWLIPVFALSFAGILPALSGLMQLLHKVFDILRLVGQERALLAMRIVAGRQ